MLVLSQYVEPVYAAELLADGRGGVGYLLKERVSEVRDVRSRPSRRVGGGGTALDPEVVAALVNPRAAATAAGRAHAARAEVLGLIAEGRSNQGIAEALVVTPGRRGEAHLADLRQARARPSEADHRRVLAVLAYLGER